MRPTAASLARVALLALAGVLAPAAPVAPALLAAPPAAAIPPAPSVLPFPLAPGATDLTTDPALVLGELPNGLRYALRANPEPRDRVSIRLVVAAGSLHETEEQRGLAHFLEHMAFNGSTHYAPGTLVEFFQRMGISFGAHANAYTYYDRTVYMLDLPNTRPETIAEGLRVFADFAGGLLLTPAEIDRERGVVLSEKLARDSGDYRAAVAADRILYAGTRIPERDAIGLESVLKEADRPRFADFYNTWYRPERMAVIVVGDIDPRVVEKPLRDALAPLAPRAPVRAEPPLAIRIPEPADAAAGITFGHQHEPEASATTVTLFVPRPADLSPDSSARRLRELPRDLAFAIVNRRLAELAKSDETPFVRALVGKDTYPRIHDGASLVLTARPGKWAETLRAGENELRRALLHGFTAAEVREVVAEMRNALEQAVKTDSTLPSSERADQLVEVFLEGQVPTTPAANLALYGPALEKVTPADCREALAAAFSGPGGRRIAVVGNDDLGAPDAALAAIARVYAHAAELPVTPPAERADGAWAYTDFGPAGAVAERRDVEDLAVTQVVFANGVRLNLKRTEFEAGVINLLARVGTGQLTEPRDQPGLGFFAGAAFTAGGLGKHSADELRRLLAGRNVGLGLRVDDDALAFNGKTTPADLVLQLQLLAASLTDPGYRSEAELLTRRRMEPFYARVATEPEGVLQVEGQRLLASGDPRLGLPRREEAFARTLAELRAWLAPQLARGAVELSLVGDLDVDAAIQAVAATVGALPSRELKPALEEQRRIAYPPAGEHTLRYQGKIAKTLYSVYWPTTDARDVRVTRRLRLLADILSDRLRTAVREEIGGSYSPDAGSTPSQTYRGYGYLAAQVLTDAKDLKKVRAAVLEAAADLAAKGVTEDELNRARQPVLTTLGETRRNNAYWLNTVLGSSQEQPERLDWSRTMQSDHEAITKAELDALARDYLPVARAIQLTVVPAE